MLNFTVGPVMESESVRYIGAQCTPYFRTDEFSLIMKENENLMKKFSDASSESRVVFLTGSGTAAMEAAVINTINLNDKVLVINGGSFGARFVELCDLHKFNFTEICIESGKNIKKEDLLPYEGQGYTVLLVNMHETSTGVLYDMELLHSFCKRNKLLFIVDAISSFISDEISMKKLEIDVLITGSQKALACPPGVSVLVVSKNAIERIIQNDSKSMYLDLKRALLDGERGQTPFTPAVGILLQINRRLNNIEENGGIESERLKIKCIADDFREKIKKLPFLIYSENCSNTVTSLYTNKGNATKIFEVLKNEYQIWICPNGGKLKDYVFRVGHIGDLRIEYNDTLIEALMDMEERGLL